MSQPGPVSWAWAATRGECNLAPLPFTMVLNERWLGSGVTCCVTLSIRSLSVQFASVWGWSVCVWVSSRETAPFMWGPEVPSVSSVVPDWRSGQMWALLCSLLGWKWTHVLWEPGREGLCGERKNFPPSVQTVSVFSCFQKLVT